MLSGKFHYFFFESFLYWAGGWKKKRNKTWSSVSNSTLVLPFIPYHLSLIPTPCSLSPSTVPFTKFRWGLLWLWLLWLSQAKVKSTPSPRPKTGVWQKGNMDISLPQRGGWHRYIMAFWSFFMRPSINVIYLFIHLIIYTIYLYTPRVVEDPPQGASGRWTSGVEVTVAVFWVIFCVIM